jgi:hypothetical protein
MIPTRFRTTVVACVLLCPVTNSLAQPVELPVGTQSLPIATGALLELFGGSGYMILKKAAGDQATITIAKAPLAADVRVMMVTRPEGVTICTVYPSKDPKKPHECLPGNKGRIYQGKAKSLPDVGITLGLPPGVAVNASLAAGDIKSDGVEGDINVYAGDGDVTVIDGRTANSKVEVGMGGNISFRIVEEGRLGRVVDLHTPLSGQIVVTLPPRVAISYNIMSQTVPVLHPSFGVDPVKGPRIGHIGGGATEVRLTVNTGIAGRFVLRPPAPR